MRTPTLTLLSCILLLCTSETWAQGQVRYLQDAQDWTSAVHSASNNLGLKLDDSLYVESSIAWLHLDLTDSNAEVFYLATSDLLSYQVFTLTEPIELAIGGDLLPDDERPIWNSEFMIPIDSNWGNDLLVSLKISSGSTIPFRLLTVAESNNIKNGSLLRDGIFYGSIGIVVILTLFISAFYRDKHAGRLSAMLVIWLVTVLSAWGYGDIISYSVIPSLLVATSNYLIILAAIVTAWFGWHFLREVAVGSFYLRGLNTCVWIGGVCLTVSIFIGASNLPGSILMLVTGFFAVATSIVAAARGDTAAKFLVAAAILVSIPFALLFFSPPTQQVIIAIGIGSEVMVTLAVLRRIGERLRDNELQAEIAVERQRFLASMSHEIRTPLNGIIGFSELIDKETLTGESKEYFGHIYQSSKLLLNIVNDVLDYAKLNAGGIRIESEPMNVEETLEAVHSIISPLALANRVDFSYSIDDNVTGWLSSDQHRCTQILVNLGSNAVKFSKAGKVKIEAHRHNDWLRFSVTDTGIGIHRDVLSGLFNPFTQADASTARQFGGTGLGLAISKQLATLLGGTLTAQSELGIGSTFTLNIPYLEGKAPAQESREKTINLEGLHVLLAEDNSVNALLATRILEKSGICVDQAEDGSIAVQKSRSKLYDIILMDVQMPQMSGTEATAEIRRQGSDIPIIAMTANNSEGDREACLQAGMNDFVAKPIETHLLLSKLELWSGRKS